LIVCVTAGEPSLDALFEEHFGRALFLIMADMDSGKWQAVENRFPGPCGGKVPGAVRILEDHGVQVLITGRVGGTGQETLEAAGIRIFAAPAEITVRAALARFREGSLAPLG
jgi:predicted Fe-Mo cluster-binding NifX family protein